MGFDQLSLGPAMAPIQVSHWRGIREALEQAGCEVLFARVPATSNPVDRAKVLSAAISEKFPGKKVHLIGMHFFSDDRLWF
jgi:triacylglycerol lipase